MVVSLKKTTNDVVSVNESSNSSNSFINGGLKASAETLSGNGALKYSTTGNPFVDQFGVLGSYRKPRTYNEIVMDCEILWAKNKRYAVLFIFYIRMITRIVSLFNGLSTKISQKGAQLKHEGIMRMLWLYNKDNNIFWKNIGLFVSVGSWNDIFVMLRHDLMYHGWDGRILDWKKFGDLILSGLNNENTTNLVRKYLPQIKSGSKDKTLKNQANTIIGKWLASLLFGSKEVNNKGYEMYRKYKRDGTAHQWQQLISQGKHDLLDFNTIHGRALSLLVKSKYLLNHGLGEKFNEWVKKPETNVKYTGFVHEIMCSLPNHRTDLDDNVYETTNKQFKTLVNKGGEKKRTNLIVVRDTSGSMGSNATGTNYSCYNIAKALALYFSEFLTGTFENSWIEFNSAAKLHKWVGDTPVDKWYNDQSSYYGSTDFQKVINLFGRLKQEGVPESEFPTGILCISDGEFNPSSLNRTNFEDTKIKLKNYGFSNNYVNNFVVVLWNLQNNYYGRNSGKKFETYGNVPNAFYFSGYEPSVISFLDDKIKTPQELFEEAMNQEVLNMVEV